MISGRVLSYLWLLSVSSPVFILSLRFILTDDKLLLRILLTFYNPRRITIRDDDLLANFYNFLLLGLYINTQVVNDKKTRLKYAVN